MFKITSGQTAVPNDPYFIVQYVLVTKDRVIVTTSDDVIIYLREEPE
ncbi:MAG: hypothetical protein ACREHG_03970 [Candidatus Saccharimonadales bacterium]